MAQIIKHRRGSLESISSATKRAGELLVVTGSSGITAVNGDSILFVGIDGSTATPANKILQGSSVPDLSGVSYDTSVDGIPFYDSSAEKLYILNKGGNVEVKATANTGGTGIVSGSTQVKELLPAGTVSGSSQVVSILGPLNTFSASQESKDATLASYTGSVNGAISVINEFSASQESKNATLASYTGSVDIHISAINSFSSSQESKAATLASYTGSNNTNISNLIISASTAKSDAGVLGGRLDALETFSSSLDGGFVTEAELAAATGALESADNAIKGRLNNIEGFTSSIDATIKTKLNVEGVISGSSQVQIASVTGFSSYSSSVSANDVELFSSASEHEGRIDTIEASIGGASGIGQRVSSLEAFSGSQESKDSTLASYTASVDSRLNQLSVDSGSQAGRLSDLETFQSDIETAISVNGSDVVINGNLTISGTQTVVDSTTVQIGDNIIELNGSGAANGGLYVADATSPNLATGSLLWDSTNDQWVAGPKGSESKILVAGGDGVISGSSQVNADSITNFDSNVKDKLNVDGVISGSVQVNADSITNFDSNVKDKLNVEGVISGSVQVNADSITNFDANVKDKLNVEGVISGSVQVQIDSVTGFTSFSSSVDSRVDVLESAVGAGSNIDGRLTALEVFSGSQESKDSTLATYTGSVDSDITELFVTASDHESRVDALEAFSSSLDAGFVTQAELAAATGALESADDAIEVRLDGLDNDVYNLDTKNVTLATYTGSVDSRLNQLSTDSGSQAGRLNNLESFTSSIDTTIKTKLDAEAVVSSSAQVVAHLLNQATDFGSGRVSGDNFGDVAGTSAFTGSFVGDGSSLTGLVTDLRISGSTGNDTVSLLTDSLLITGSTGISTAVSNNTITISGENASTSGKGVASFDGDDFSVSSGNVSIKSSGVRADNLNSDVAGTGISLNGVDNSIEVDYGSTSGTAVEGNTSLTVQGTANEIEISGGSITLGAGGTVTIGLPNDVTIGNDLDVTNNAQVGGDLTVVGNLFVQGTTTTVDSTTIQLGDNIIELNGSGATNGGLLVKDVTSPNTVSGSLLWDSTNDFWKGGALGSEKEFVRFDTTSTADTVQKIDANGLLVDTTITDDGTDVSITGDFTIGGLTANSFVVSDGSKTLVSVVPSNAGDLIQWNGSSFVASNTVDGGTF